MIEEVMYAIILILAYPVGIIISKLCKHELKQDAKYFLYLFYVLILAFIISLIISKESLSLSLAFMIVLCSVLVKKSSCTF